MSISNSEYQSVNAVDYILVHPRYNYIVSMIHKGPTIANFEDVLKKNLIGLTASLPDKEEYLKVITNSERHWISRMHNNSDLTYVNNLLYVLDDVAEELSLITQRNECIEPIEEYLIMEYNKEIICPDCGKKTELIDILYDYFEIKSYCPGCYSQLDVFISMPCVLSLPIE